MEQNFLNLVKEVLEIENLEINMDDDFRSLEVWDSLANLSLVAMIDDEFGVVIESQRFKELKTFRDIFNEIEKTK
ncbi:MAG: acyl carrier protein [Bacteroidia bacterium]|nr:acyl carrier protein [Bacteroidia bacterium]MCF8445930.1 acyl carrier protein [Bacteroidia bacterium]